MSALPMWPDRSANHHEDPIAAALGGVARTARACLHIANYAVSSVGAAHVGPLPDRPPLELRSKNLWSVPWAPGVASTTLRQPENRGSPRRASRASIPGRRLCHLKNDAYLLNTDRNSVDKYGICSSIWSCKQPRPHLPPAPLQSDGDFCGVLATA